MCRSDKTKLAIWVVSHCETASKREKYVQQLQKYMEVDIFGACGKPMKCPDIGNCTQELANICKNKNDDVCKTTVEKRYKFYLAFENSRCDDYWTEKLSHCYHLPIVPVVMGGANYSNVLPKEAYINVDDYSSPKELADYLNHLDSHWVTENYFTILDIPYQCIANFRKITSSTLNGEKTTIYTLRRSKFELMR